MSTNHSVGTDLVGATRQKDRFTATQEKVRSAATQENDRSAVKPKKDRSGLCAFTFADGRQCRTPRCSGHLHLCYFHAQKEAEARIAKQARDDLSSVFSEHYISACDLSPALGHVFSAVANGPIRPKAATALAVSF